MTYTTEAFCRILLGGQRENKVNVLSRGRVVAECNTQAMADRVANGLYLDWLETKKKNEFRL